MLYEHDKSTPRENHPDIGAIYGLEQSGNLHYLAMELVPGQTLAERIRGGAIPEFRCEALLLDYPHYTRPAEFRGWTVPEIPFSGHEEIRRWRRQVAEEKMRWNRPDLLGGNS